MLTTISILFIIGTFMLLAVARISADVEEAGEKGIFETLWDEITEGTENFWDDLWDFGSEDTNDGSGSVPEYPEDDDLDDDSDDEWGVYYDDDDATEWAGNGDTDEDTSYWV